MQSNVPERRRTTRDYAPKRNRKGPITVLPLMLLFIGILIVMYLIFPKAAGRHVTSTIYDGLVISEVMAANSSAVPDENGDFPDWMELYNGTGADLNLEGVMITNRSDRITFPFPSYVLKAGERVIIFASNSYQMDPSKPFHGKFKISSVGDHIYLYDPNMYLIDEIITPTLTADSSYILTDIAEDGTRQYEITDYYSPGFENTEEGFVAYRQANSMESGALVINEVCPAPRVGIPDEDGEIVDWIELRNTTGQPISLKGMFLSDKENKPMQWRFPDSAVVPAYGYYLVYCSGKDKLQENGIPHTNFSISAERETIVLSDSYGRMIDRISIENVPADYSVGRNEVGAWEFFDVATPGYSNDKNGQSKADELIRAYNPTGVFISEVMASNDTTVLGNTSYICDFVELYNSTDHEVDLSFYGLSDSITRPRKWQFPQGAVIGAGEYKIIFLDGKPELTTYYEYHTNFSIARAGGETITFCDPSGKVLDRLPLSMIPTDHSYGRTWGYPGFYYYDVPTPGAANGTGYYGYTSNPAFSMRGGEYKSTIQVSMTIPENTTVYYTTDGTIPTEASTVYNPGDVFEISRVTVLRARAFDNSGTLQPSEVITQTYLLNVYHAFPIVSLVTDPNELWNAETGMLTVGENVIKDKIPFKNTIYRMVKEQGIGNRPGYVEYYDKEGNQVLSQAVEFGLQGQYSLDMPQKSFKVRAKAKYGSKYFDAKLFDDRPYTQYKSFVLRMGGNDSAWTRLIDGYQGHLLDCFNEVSENPTDVIHQAWKPVVVYLNGVYWGHYNMRERVDRFFVAQHEGLPLDQADEMDILEASGKVHYGSKKEYADMIKKVKTLSPGKKPEDLKYITDCIDVDNYFDYIAFEMFFGNSDPGNIRFYKLKTEGSKWKWIIYDLDYGLFSSGFDSPTSYLKDKGAGQQNIDNTLIKKLLENAEMQDKFLTRLGEIYQVFTTDFMLAEFEKMAAILEPEMPLHFARWAEETDKAITFDNPTTPEGALRYWHSRLDRTRNVLRKRPTYFYEMMQERFALTDEQMVTYFGPKPPLPPEAEYTEGKKWS